MGKNSLIKSTDTKKTEAGKSAAKTTTNAAKKNAEKITKKAAPKKDAKKTVKKTAAKKDAKKKTVKKAAPKKKATPAMAAKEKTKQKLPAKPVARPASKPGASEPKQPYPALVEPAPPGFFSLSTLNNASDKLDKFTFTAIGGLMEGLGTFKRVVRSQSDLPRYPEVKIGLVVCIILFGLLLGVSFINSGQFSFVQNEDGAQMLRGRFAPAGEKVVEAFPGLALPDPGKTDYSAAAAYAIARGYHLDKYEAVMSEPGLPDYGVARSNLVNALVYAYSLENKKDIWALINSLDFQHTMQGVDQALGADVALEAKKAQALLDKASSLARTKEELATIKEQKAKVENILETLGE